ncbi:hypothetical protein E0Z10_g3855 [Xylaria hypoxylon]|uniref:C2H2-type domain-containing protein n=1 Tax=Xylaria hypoxylon TaxID=37992 RepID=A0A4Z0Z0L4_9PEZI|nr:hypothetical protein E0Z10_g3855 [Xylaria hypoxylon]
MTAKHDHKRRALPDKKQKQKPKPKPKRKTKQNSKQNSKQELKSKSTSTSKSTTPKLHANLDKLAERRPLPDASLSNSDQEPSSRPVATFACPFYKYSPADYQPCARLNLSKISYVKQHLVRRHMAPKHCPRCLKIFPTYNDIVAHLRGTVRCKESSGNIEGITETKKEMLSRRSDQSLGEEGKWFELWDILFAQECRPVSPYVDLDLPEEVNWLRDYLMSEVPERLHERQILQSQAAMRQVVGTLVETVQDWKDLWKRGRIYST